MAASPQAVFDAWLTPEKIRQWFAPGLGEMVRIEVDARLGGKFSFVQRRGNDDVDHVGEYLVMDRPHRLVFTWGVPKYTPDVSRVSVEIQTAPMGCQVALVHELHPNWADYVQRTEQAWAKMLEAMATAVQET